MTLCVVWRPKGGVIQVAADSRVSFGSDAADVAVKVTALPMRLYHATPHGSDELRLAYERILGLAVVGSLPTTYIAKELLQGVLGSLQFAEGIADISMNGVARVVATVFRSVSRDVCRAIFERGRGQLILVGHCLEHRTGRAFLLSVETTSGKVDVEISELLTSNNYAFFGSGASAATALHAANPDSPGYRIVRAVCDDPAVPSVGGNIQFGILDSEDFRVMGIRDYRVNSHLKEIYTAFYMAGVELYGGQNLLGDSGFAVRSAFLNAFEADILSLMNQGYAVVNSDAHW
ncbi:MAG: hypothetical protein ABSD47_10175 [Candidatus Methylomirabilota bacterium]|jgi:hypothetical protein